MFDDAPHGARLAWICLLCFAKAQGRAGKVRFRGKAFAENYRLSMESVDELLARAGKAGAVTVEGDMITVVNWKCYQDPKARHSSNAQHQGGKRLTKKRRQISKSTENDATQHPPPSTQHQAPSTRDARAPTIAEVKAYCAELGYTMDAEKFWYHFEARGWRTREGPLKSWKAAVVNWQKNEKNYGKPNGHQQPSRVGAGQRFRG